MYLIFFQLQEGGTSISINVKEEEEVNKVDDDMGRYGRRDKVGNLGGPGGRYDS